MSGIRKPIKRLIIEVDGDLDFPSPSSGFIGQIVSVSLVDPKVSAFQASMKRGQSSEVTVSITCNSAVIAIVPSRIDGGK
jgi:hypothetical protein